MHMAENVTEELWFADDNPRIAHDLASRSMAATIATTMALKPFPHTAREVMGVLQRPNHKVHDVEHALQADPSLTGRILTVANFPTYSPRKKVESIRQALVLLGSGTVRDLVIAESSSASWMCYDAEGLLQLWNDAAGHRVRSRDKHRKYAWRAYSEASSPSGAGSSASRAAASRDSRASSRWRSS